VRELEQEIRVQHEDIYLRRISRMLELERLCAKLSLFDLDTESKAIYDSIREQAEICRAGNKFACSPPFFLIFCG